MSSRQWPAGALRAALLTAHAEMPSATAPQLARHVGCEPGSARVVLKTAGVRVPLGKPQRLIWTPEMKAVLADGACRRLSVDTLAERIGVAPQALVLGAFEVIREMAR